MSIVLISVKPEYAEQIFARSKQFELRRRCTGVKSGDQLMIYSTHPVKAILGTCRVVQVIAGAPVDVYRAVRGRVGVNRHEFDSYFFGASRAYALKLSQVRRLQQAIKLDVVRERVRGFVVPQSYRYLRNRELDLLAVD